MKDPYINVLEEALKNVCQREMRSSNSARGICLRIQYCIIVPRLLKIAVALER